MKYLLLSLFVLTLIISSSCGSSQTLYSGTSYTYDTKYPEVLCEYLVKSDEKETKDLIELYEELIEDKESTTRKIPAPGVYADYGFILIEKGEIEKGKEMLKKEIEFYPESSVFINNFLKTYEK